MLVFIYSLYYLFLAFNELAWRPQSNQYEVCVELVNVIFLTKAA